MENPIYLGDGLYGYFDGNGIELRLNSHAAPCAVYLEPEVLRALAAFWSASKAESET
jgi:hypothetical protein